MRGAHPPTPAKPNCLAVSYCLYQMSWGVLLVVVPVAISRGLSSAAHADLAVGLLWAVAGLTGGLGALLAGRVRTIGRERQMIGFGIAATAIRADRPSKSPCENRACDTRGATPGINHPLKEGLKAALPSEHRRKALTPDEAPIMIRTANAAWMRAFA